MRSEGESATDRRGCWRTFPCFPIYFPSLSLFLSSLSHTHTYLSLATSHRKWEQPCKQGPTVQRWRNFHPNPISKIFHSLIIPHCFPLHLLLPYNLKCPIFLHFKKIPVFWFLEKYEALTLSLNSIDKYFVLIILDSVMCDPSLAIPPPPYEE